MTGQNALSDLRSTSRLRWTVLSTVSAMFFFLNLATFQSLGVVLFKMVAELHWSATAAGSSFAFLGLACGFTSPLPAITIRKIGSRATMCIGAGLLVAGFWLCARGHDLVTFYAAMTLIGAGFSFGGTVPGVYLIVGWFERHSARVIGFYFMFGALGAAFGPPIVDGIVRAIGWRGHWLTMAVAAAFIGVMCLLFVRDIAEEAPAARQAGDATHPTTRWTPRQAIMTYQFALIAAAMAGTMGCVTTLSSVVVGHLVKLGATPTRAAFVFGALGLTATLVKALAGWACEKFRPAMIAAAGLLLQMAGNILFAYADTAGLQYLAAVTFGTGWGLTYVGGTVLLVDYFGGAVGSRILSVVWLASSIAAGGPVLAGVVADRFGTFVPIFILFGVLMLALAIPIWRMRPPAGPEPSEDAGSVLLDAIPHRDVA
ncbi:MAG: MFS transporter [Proteobacteria bacterium]|nr:MFS transporter [Pseudomonadota bacterium]